MDLNKLKGHIPDRIFAILPPAFEKYGIDTALKASHFLAQIAHESGDFTIKTENMNYTTPQRVVDIWPSRFNLTGEGGKKNANEYVKNPEKLANAVYGGRMGNDNPGDGFRFRGGGYLQCTGREAYKGYSEYLKKDIGEKAERLTPLVGFEFTNSSDLFRSIDDWTENNYQVREKDIVLRYLAEVKNK